MEKLIMIAIPIEKFESSEYDVFLASWVKLIKATEDFLFVSVPESKRFDLFSYAIFSYKSYKNRLQYTDG